MAKKKATKFVCQACGYESPKWMGRCPNCGAWNQMMEELEVDKNDRQKMTVTSVGSRPAVTHFKVLKRYNDMTLVECQLETGRTHQIRVHFQYIGYPIVGDPKYSIRNTPETQGQCLHAYKIEFVHPRTNELMQFSAEMPDVFKKVLEELE